MRPQNVHKNGAKAVHNDIEITQVLDLEQFCVCVGLSMGSEPMRRIGGRADRLSNSRGVQYSRAFFPQIFLQIQPSFFEPSLYLKYLELSEL